MFLGRVLAYIKNTPIFHRFMAKLKLIKISYLQLKRKQLQRSSLSFSRILFEEPRVRNSGNYLNHLQWTWNFLIVSLD